MVKAGVVQFGKIRRVAVADLKALANEAKVIGVPFGRDAEQALREAGLSEDEASS